MGQTNFLFLKNKPQDLVFESEMALQNQPGDTITVFPCQQTDNEDNGQTTGTVMSKYT